MPALPAGTIASGSLSPGVDPAGWGLPAGTALRWERSDERLRALMPSYAVLDSDPAVWTGPNSWALPGWPQLWIVLTDAPVTLSVRNRPAAPLGAAVLVGPTSRAMPATTHGGVSIVVDLSPAGWARWMPVAAAAARDRVVPLEELFGSGWATELVERLHASDRAGAVKPLLDAFFLDRLPAPQRDEAEVTAVAAGLADPNVGGSGALAAQLGMTERRLQRLCNRHLGYGPAVIRRRARLLRVLAGALADPDVPLPATPPGYHDASHFNRDGHDFLGLTPRRFLALPMPYLRAVLRGRRDVIGAPLPLLD